MPEHVPLCRVEPGLAGHVVQLLADARIPAAVDVAGEDDVVIGVADGDYDHARAVIGLVLPQLLVPDGPGLSQRLVRSAPDEPAQRTGGDVGGLPGGLLDARPSHGYADPLAERDDDGDYVPPEPPPLPRPNGPLEKASWLGLVLGPLLLIAVAVFPLPGYLTAVGLVCFFGGLGLLVFHRDESPRDGWDDGAVV